MWTEFNPDRAIRLVAFGLALAAIGPLGCGSSGPELASVSGQVTYQGKPVTLGMVTFLPLNPDGRTATGQIDSSGNYTLQTQNPGDGALLGDYRVTIFAQDNPVLDYIPKKKVPPKRLVPEKYEKPDTSGLKETVNSGSNTINFDLTE
ncbi:hypothetical protein P12x_004136 [Tundrisphaera lichenicola]|uniref:hypothetical protein n=1 Tax=Tundrisphaera lichenicola TaxID=2029860 RepID=UPI003EB79833